MPGISIICPHCEFSKEVPEEKLPSNTVNIACPRCKQSFQYHPVAGDTDLEFDIEPTNAIHGDRYKQSGSQTSIRITSIDGLAVSDKWKRIFRTFSSHEISRVGFWGCPEYKSDDVKLKSKGTAIYKSENIICNWWAFCFGPYWYLSKKLWKKGLLLILLSIIVEIICSAISPQLAGPALMVTGAIALYAANYDYYRARVLNESFWW